MAGLVIRCYGCEARYRHAGELTTGMRCPFCGSASLTRAADQGGEGLKPLPPPLIERRFLSKDEEATAARLLASVSLEEERHA